MVSNYHIGAGWAPDGPQAGYFPLRIGAIIFVACLAVLWQAWRTASDATFVTWPQLRQVAVILVPLTIYVALIKFLGIYVASAIFIAGFMRVMGKFAWWRAVLTGVGHQRGAVLDLRDAVPRATAERGRSKRRSVSWRGTGVEELKNSPDGRLCGRHVVAQRRADAGRASCSASWWACCPGLGGPNGVAILLPLTFSMEPTSAIIMLSCIYWGALFGGAITSILFNIPGEAWSVATTFDGYPMAQQGEAGRALTSAFTGSFLGALAGVLLITFLAPLVAKFALRFGPPEFFAVYFLRSAASSAWAGKPRPRS